MLENEFQEMLNNQEKVNHPQHYRSGNGIEVIDVIEGFTEGMSGVDAFALGNAIKYLCRCKKKNGLEDIKKARWYIDYLINHLESQKG